MAVRRRGWRVRDPLSNPPAAGDRRPARRRALLLRHARCARVREVDGDVHGDGPGGGDGGRDGGGERRAPASARSGRPPRPAVRRRRAPGAGRPDRGGRGGRRVTHEGRFAGRNVLVTGSTGMAASAARAIAAEGGGVFCVSRTAEHLETLAADVRGTGGRVEIHFADLRREEDVEAAFAAFDATFGRLDAVYSVAGISGRRFGDGPVHLATLEGWDAVLAANATSQFLVARASIRRMLAQAPDSTGSRGALLLMSSTLATHPAPVHFGTHAYAASKGAIEALARSLAATYAREAIRVNAIAPALIATPMSRRAQDDPEILAYLAARQPLAGGPIDADAVTPTALHLLSTDAGMVTGQVIAVDGGWTVSDAVPVRPSE